MKLIVAVIIGAIVGFIARGSSGLQTDELKLEARVNTPVKSKNDDGSTCSSAAIESIEHQTRLAEAQAKLSRAQADGIAQESRRNVLELHRKASSQGSFGSLEPPPR